MTLKTEVRRSLHKYHSQLGNQPPETLTLMFPGPIRVALPYLQVMTAMGVLGIWDGKTDSVPTDAAGVYAQDINRLFLESVAFSLHLLDITPDSIPPNGVTPS